MKNLENYWLPSRGKNIIWKKLNLKLFLYISLISIWISQIVTPSASANWGIKYEKTNNECSNLYRWILAKNNWRFYYCPELANFSTNWEKILNKHWCNTWITLNYRDASSIGSKWVIFWSSGKETFCLKDYFNITKSLKNENMDR